MSEDRMQGIPRWRPFRNLSGLAPDKNGEWVRYVDASRALRKLRDALENARSTLSGYRHSMGKLVKCDSDCNCDRCAARAIIDAALREAK